MSSLTERSVSIEIRARRGEMPTQHWANRIYPASIVNLLDSNEAIMTTRKPKPTPSPLIELIELSTEQLQLVAVTAEPKAPPRRIWGTGTEVPVLRVLPRRGKSTLH
jgi:hypothetical protein